VDKRDVARTLEEIAVLLELKGENPFKIRAYENAARAIDGLSQELGALIEEGKLIEVPGIGETISGKVAELWKSGRMKYYEELVDSTPPGYVEMLRVPGLGAKKVRALGGALGITSLADLKRAAEKGEIRDLKGFGEQSEKKILAGIALLEAGAGRRLGGEVRPLAEDLLEKLRRLPQVTEAEVGGSLRRWMETVKDVDLLVATEDPAQVGKAFVNLLPDAGVIASGGTKISLRLPDGLAVDLRLVSPQEFPFALHYFTGSVAHNIRVRARALDRGWSLNEYALSGTKKHPPIASEADLFRVLGLATSSPSCAKTAGRSRLRRRTRFPSWWPSRT